MRTHISIVAVSLFLSCTGGPGPNRDELITGQQAPTLSGFIFIGKEDIVENSWQAYIYRHQITGMDFILIDRSILALGPKKYCSDAFKLLPFLIGKTEVTRRAWSKALEPKTNNFNKEDYPVGNVSWIESMEWCENAGLRLPTESEWMFALEAGAILPIVSKGAIGNYAWFIMNSGGSVWPVGKKLPNALGLFDMIGNVGEWVLDCCVCGLSKACDCSKRAGIFQPPDRIILGANSINSLDSIKEFVDLCYSSEFVGFRAAATPSYAPALSQ